MLIFMFHDIPEIIYFLFIRIRFSLIKNKVVIVIKKLNSMQISNIELVVIVSYQIS